MAYKRKTIDVYDIEGNYGQGFEAVNTETDWNAARRSIREYRENEPGIAFRLKRRRERIDSKA